MKTAKVHCPKVPEMNIHVSAIKEMFFCRGGLRSARVKPTTNWETSHRL